MTEPKTTTAGAAEAPKTDADVAVEQTHEQRVAAAQETHPMPSDGGEYRREADGSLTRLDEAPKPARWKSEPAAEVEAAPMTGADATLREASDAPVTGDAAKPQRTRRNADTPAAD